MRSLPNPRAAWPSSDDNTGFNLIVILLGCCVGAYLLWTCYHGEISACVIALRHHEIGFIQLFTDRYDLANRQMLAADPEGVTLRDLYGHQSRGRGVLSHPRGGLHAAAGSDMRRAGRAGALQTGFRSRRSDPRTGPVFPNEHCFCPPPPAPCASGFCGGRRGAGRSPAGRLRIDARGVDRPFCDRLRRRL